MAELAREDFRTAVWKKVEKYANDRLDEHRKRNDGDLNADKTANLRGRIAELKALLDLARVPPEVEAEPDDPN